MNQYRQSQGVKGWGKDNVRSVEEVTEQQSPNTNEVTPSNTLNNLESKGGWRRVRSNIETKTRNRFAVLSETSDEEE